LEANQPWNKKRVFPSRARRPQPIGTFVLETFVSLPAGTFTSTLPVAGNPRSLDPAGGIHAFVRRLQSQASQSL
jgi:hypothetical protein